MVHLKQLCKAREKTTRQKLLLKILKYNKCKLAAVTGGGGQNKQHVTTKNTAKLDRETEELKHGKVSLDLGKVIQQGRQAKGWSQKDLATVSQHHVCTLEQTKGEFRTKQSFLPSNMTKF